MEIRQLARGLTLRLSLLLCLVLPRKKTRRICRLFIFKREKLLFKQVKCEQQENALLLFGEQENKQENARSLVVKTRE